MERLAFEMKILPKQDFSGVKLSNTRFPQSGMTMQRDYLCRLPYEGDVLINMTSS